MAGVKKLDPYRDNKQEYGAGKKPRLVDVGPGRYLMAPGNGAPGGEVFVARMPPLYGMAYTLKFASKAAGRDYVVGKLEGIWWAEGREMQVVADIDSTDLRWKLLMRVPDFITGADLAAARRQLHEKGKGEGVEQIGLEEMAEGRCVQALHVGPYDQEDATMALMREFAAANGLRLEGRHHEIYLSDPNRTAPEKLRTILRNPVGDAGGQPPADRDAPAG
jgi:hypothetical protein